ncbi:MAG: NUDIX hydrolase [bacterium]
MQTRTNVAVVIKHWSEDKYLLIKWKNQFGVSFVTGGVDRGESLAEAAIREGQEET